jgi:hypothetical protein
MAQASNPSKYVNTLNYYSQAKSLFTQIENLLSVIRTNFRDKFGSKYNIKDVAQDVISGDNKFKLKGLDRFMNKVMIEYDGNYMMMSDTIRTRFTCDTAKQLLSLFWNMRKREEVDSFTNEITQDMKIAVQEDSEFFPMRDPSLKLIKVNHYPSGINIHLSLSHTAPCPRLGIELQVEFIKLGTKKLIDLRDEVELVKDKKHEHEFYEIARLPKPSAMDDMITLKIEIRQMLANTDHPFQKANRYELLTLLMIDDLVYFQQMIKSISSRKSYHYYSSYRAPK